ncbi:galactosylceramide sulfotransferase-like [Convolutriloba macropyga]|uniref:galactosylceramide sulfotransferase-like n=1 Tax=Convolutriloba macropyga TaxID=536237 RepID=UPI003F51F46B
MQVLHHVFVPKVWHSLLEPGYKLLGVIRNPFDHFTSVFNYFAVSVRISREFNVSNATAFDYFLKHPNVYFKYFAHDDGNFIFKNPLLFDFGYTEDSNVPLKRFLAYVKRRFAVVLVADYMDESLILLKRTLCWNMRDILIFSKNKSRWKNIADPSTMPKGEKLYQEREALYKKWSKEDIIFYDTFLQILRDRIAKEPFFQEELNVYRRVREITRKYCNKSVGLNKPVIIKASVFNEQFKIDKYLCNRLRLHVLNYILKLQNKNNRTLQVLQGIRNSKFQWSDENQDAMGEFVKPDKKINLLKVSARNLKGKKYQLTKGQLLRKQSIGHVQEDRGN